MRVFRLAEPFLFPDSPRYGGCRSWVELPEVPETITSAPVLAEAEHRERERQSRTALELRGS